MDTGAIEMKSYLIGYTQGVEYKAIKDPTLLYDRYELTLSKFHVTILDQGLPEGMKAFSRGEGSPAIKEFSAVLNILNCVEPLHPLYPTLETSIVIKNFEVLLSLRFLDGLLRIKNSVVLALDTSSEDALHKALRKERPFRLAEAIGKDIMGKVRTAVEKHVIYDDEGDSFYDMIEDHLKDEDKAMVSSDSKQASGQMASFRLYFSVEHLSVIM